MNITCVDGQSLSLSLGGVEFKDLRPVINGFPVTDWAGDWHASQPGRWERQGRIGLGEAYFGMAIDTLPEGHLTLRYWLVSFPPGEVDSLGVQFGQVTGLHAYLRSGYTSWDGSFYVEPGALPDVTGLGVQMNDSLERLAKGYALTQLLPEGGPGSVVLGFERHDRFQYTFTFHLDTRPLALTVLTLWDRKSLCGQERVESERLLIFAHPEVENALRHWAELVARASAQAAADTSPFAPRKLQAPITGWCSWYNLYAAITTENLREHLQAAQQAARAGPLPLHVFQIDDGFTPEMGDWLETKPQFPVGMQPLLDEIRKAGFTPGLWIAPFMVGNRSQLYQAHPDWVVQDRQTGAPLVEMSFYGEFRWHKRSEEYYILDVTHPEAFDYIRSVFRTWRRDWGCEYFKTDFMYFGTGHGPDRALWFMPGLTRIEIWRKMAEMIREEIGEALWLGCGCPLWASVGLVDAIRIGKDVGVEWKKGAESLLQDQATRNFGHGILWATDPDCILLRSRFHHLTDAELEALALYAGMAGGVRMTSDHLGELTTERLRLWRLILSWSAEPCRFPFLGQTRLVYERVSNAETCTTRVVAHAQDPVLVQVRAVTEKVGQVQAVFLFNTGEFPVHRRYAYRDLGCGVPVQVSLWPNAERSTAGDSLVCDLGPHQGKLFFLWPDIT